MQTTYKPPRFFEIPPPPANRRGWPWITADQFVPATLPSGRPWPQITVVTPSYNQAQFLEETLRSVLLQGYPNLEYVVMDGASTDGSVAIIERYAPWLAYWQSGKDGGQSAAIADGFARSHGAIMAWLNSDDRLRPGALFRVARYFDTHPQVVFANGDVNLIDASGLQSRRTFAIRPVPHITANIGAHSWMQQGSFWRRSAYDRIGGLDRNLRFCMDRDLFLRLARSGPSSRIPGPPLGDFRLHGEAKTARWGEIQQHEDRILRERHGSPLRHNSLYQFGLRMLWEVEVIKRGLRRRFIHMGFEV